MLAHESHPHHSGELRLERRSRARTSVLDPDWLVMRPLLADVRAALAAHARGALLDVGCGGRPYEDLLPPGVRYFGSDLQSTTSAADVWSFAEALPFHDRAFETVVCTQVVEHLPDPTAALAEIARVLKPGGKLVLTAPQAANLHEAPFDFYRYTRYGLAQLCLRAGLEVLEVRAQGGFWATAGFFLTVHLGSYARALSTRGAGRAAAAAPKSPGAWKRWFWPLRLPMAAVNLFFATLDRIPQPGLFALNHLIVARKPERPG